MESSFKSRHFCDEIIRIMFCYIAPSSGSICIKEYSWANICKLYVCSKDVDDVPVKQDDCYQKIAA